MKRKVVFVTGSSKGIGKGIATEFAKKGYIVVLNCKNSVEKMMETARELEKYTDVMTIQCDVSNYDNAKKAIDSIVEKYGRIDVLINNAGIDKIQLVTEVTKKDWDEIINTNLYGTFYISQQAAKNMIQNKQGKIINISSIWGQIGASMEVVYSISKAGVDGLTKALAKELGPSGIQVNSIAPGFIKTEMNSNFNEQEINEIKDEIPLQKLGECTDIARCVKWLIEDNYVTGQVIAINGGWSIT